MFRNFRGMRIERNYMVALALLFNTFSWYMLGQSIVNRIAHGYGTASADSLILGIIYQSSIIASAIFASIFLKGTRKARFFSIWILIGVAVSAFSTVSANYPPYLNFTVIGLLGLSLGVGMPSCLSYFAESISIEHRGKAGGITLFASFFSMALMLVPLSTLDFVFSAAILVMWRAWSLPLVFLISERSPLEKGFKSRSMSSVLHNKAFLLYFAAWLMFSFVNSIEGVVVGLTAEFQFFIRIIEPAIASFSALIAGILSDWMGRRRVLISGFVSLGIAYATIGFLSQLWIAWLFYFIIDGIAIGALWVLFVLVLWGDLAQNGSEKFYAIGQTPFFLTEIIVLLSAPYLSSIPATSSFSLAAFFLFLAVLPLLYAQETLPEKSIRERELKIYVGQAKKIKEKHA